MAVSSVRADSLDVDLLFDSFNPHLNPHPYAALGQIYRAFWVFPRLGDGRFHAWTNLELVKAQFSNRKDIYWTIPIFIELLQDRNIRAVRWFFQQGIIQPKPEYFDLAYSNCAHTVIRTFFEYGITKNNGVVASWLKTTSCFEYLIRTENRNLLQLMLQQTQEYLGLQPLYICLNDLDGASLAVPPFQCTKSVRLEMYSQLIYKNRYPNTWPFETILTMNQLTDQERLNLLRVSHDANNVIPDYKDDLDVRIRSFLISRRQVPEYLEFLKILIELGFKANSDHPEIYEDCLGILLSMNQCDPRLWVTLPELPADVACRCLDKVLQSNVKLPQLSIFDSNNDSYDPNHLISKVYHCYLTSMLRVKPHILTLLKILYKWGHQPPMWPLAQGLIRSPSTLDLEAREFLCEAGLTLTLSELFTNKHCTNLGDVVKFQRDLQQRQLDFLLTLTPQEQKQLDTWISQMREALGDTSENLIVDLTTIRSQELVLVRGFDESGTLLVNMIMRVKGKGSRKNRADIGYGLSIITSNQVDRNRCQNNYAIPWIKFICEGPQPNYCLKARVMKSTKSIREVRLFRIPQPSLVQLSVLEVRRRHSRTQVKLSQLPMELQEMIYPSWMNWV